MLIEVLFTINLLASSPDYLDISEYSDLELKPKANNEQQAAQEKPVKKRQNISKKQMAFPIISPIELKPLFTKYGVQYGVSEQILTKIASCESSFNSYAINGPYAGMYQFTSNTWVSNRKAMGLNPDPVLRFNPEEAIKTTAFKISRDGTSAWPVCGR